MKRIGLFLLAVVMMGCASTPRRSYTGPELPVSQVARINVEVKERTFGDTLLKPKPAEVYITHVDQQPLGSFWGARGELFKVVDLLPGSHTVQVVMSGHTASLVEAAVQSSVNKNSAHLASGYGMVFTVDAKAGHTYVVKYIQKRLPLIAWIEDAETGETVSGEKPDLSQIKQP